MIVGMVILMNINKIMFLFENNNQCMGVDFTLKTTHYSCSAQQVLHEACLMNGHTIKGSVDAIRHHLKIRQKCPVLISVVNKCLFFPLPLAHHHQLVWVRYVPSIKCKMINQHQTLVNILDHQFTLDVNQRMIKRQIKRCQAYVDILTKNELEWDCRNASPIGFNELLQQNENYRKEYS